MAQQITWRNINEPNLGDSARMFSGAQQSFGSAIDALSRVLQQREATDASNWKVQKDNNTQAALDSIFKFRTPEELAAARASGTLDAQLAGFGPQVDRAAIRGAADNRLNTLYQQAQAADAYTSQQRETRLAPLVQQAQAFVAGNDQAGLKTFLAANPELMQFKGGDLVKAGVVSARDAARFGWDEAQAKRLAERAPIELKKLEEDIKNGRIQANAAATSANAAATNAETNRKELTVRTEERLQNQLDSVLSKQAALGATIASPEGTKYVMDELSKVVSDKGDLRRLQVSLGELAQDKEFSGLSPSAVLTALVGDQSTGTSFRKFFWNGTGDGVKGALRDIMKSPDFQKQAINQEAQRQVLQQRANDLRSALYPDRAAASPAPAPVPAPVPNTPAPAPVLNLPAPTQLPANTRPDRGPARFPWESRRVELPFALTTGDKIYDEVLASEFARLAAAGQVPVNAKGEINYNAIEPKKLEEIRKRVAQATDTVLPKAK